MRPRGGEGEQPMHRILIIAGLSLLCSGCLTTEEQAEQAAAADDASCQSYGAKRGTDLYIQCRMQKDQQRQANRAAVAAAIASQPAPQPYYAPVPMLPPPPVVTRPTNCMSMPMGNMVSTTCN